jgi:hypothetical protein
MGTTDLDIFGHARVALHHVAYEAGDQWADQMQALEIKFKKRKFAVAARLLVGEIRGEQVSNEQLRLMTGVPPETLRVYRCLVSQWMNLPDPKDDLL